jgi:hypothetical protein
MTKVLLTSPITPISPSPYSHRSAQGEIYADQLKHMGYDVTVNYGGKQDLDDFDEVFIYHGNDFGGGLNLFGGLSGLADPAGLVKLFHTNKTVTSLGIPMPDYAKLINDRLAKSKDHDPILNTIDWAKANSLPDRTKFVRFLDTPARSLVVGDSHAIAQYARSVQVHSIPFKTLHGALEIGLDKLVEEIGPRDKWDRIFLYFGNIDIRHHLCRQPEPLSAARDLASRYMEQARGLYRPGSKVRIFEPMPIENESRKLPKTGYYKGTPFYGSWAERDAVRAAFIDQLKIGSDNDVSWMKWTDYLKNEKGELDFEHMERPRSVHLARASYPHWQGPLPPVKEKPAKVAKTKPVAEESAGLATFFG